MITKKRMIALMAVVALVIICAVSLVGCGGQQLTADEFTNIFKAENLDKIENYSYSYVTRFDKETVSVDNYVVDGNKVKYTSVDGVLKRDELAIAKKEERKANRDVYETQIIYDLSNQITYKYNFKDKKYTKTDGAEEFIVSKILDKYLTIKFENFEYKKGVYTDADTIDAVTSTLEIRFSKDNIYYLADFIKDDGAKFNKNEFYFEVYVENVKLPKDKQIA